MHKHRVNVQVECLFMKKYLQVSNKIRSFAPSFYKEIKFIHFKKLQLCQKLNLK